MHFSNDDIELLSGFIADRCSSIRDSDSIDFDDLDDLNGLAMEVIDEINDRRAVLLSQIDQLDMELRDNIDDDHIL